MLPLEGVATDKIHRAAQQVRRHIRRRQLRDFDAGQIVDARVLEHELAPRVGERGHDRLAASRPGRG